MTKEQRRRALTGQIAMEEHTRHQRIWRLLYALTHRWICRKFNMTHQDLDMEGPVLLVSNHVSAWDPLLVAMSLRRKQVYFVASEHIFRWGCLSRLIRWLVAPIPRRKASMGADTVKACLRHLKDGHSICLFAEGEQCWDGRSQPVFSATGKLARSSGAALVTYRLEGGYLSLPRWGRGVRRGRVHGGPVGVYLPEQLQAMTPEEINAAIERDIYEDAWQRQQLENVAYRGRRTAEGMERALYLCPCCRGLGTLKTQEDRLFCRCGLSLRYTPTGAFDPPEPFADIARWEDWQRRRLRERDFSHRDHLFSDPDVSLAVIGAGHRETEADRGELQQYEDRLVCGGHSFAMAEITAMAMVQADLLLFSCGGAYYQLRSRGSANLRKYLEIWKQR